MALLGIKVVATDGDAITPRQAVIRTVTLPLSFLLFGLGFIGILLNKDRHALHDRLARTVVVYSWDARAARLRWLAKREPTTPSLIRWSTVCCPAGPRRRLPGVVHLPGWLDADLRVDLVARCRDWGEASGGPRPPRMVNGAPMSVAMVGLGWHWYPYRYSRTRDDGDGGHALTFPSWLGDLAVRAVADAVVVDPAVAPDPDGFEPDVALVNWYGPGAKMGMHVDDDEAVPAPVVSFSVGATGLFRFGNTHGRGRPWVDLLLESGDVVVFGGPARLAYHGVPRLLPGTDDPAVGDLPGRLNVTVRQTGLTG